MALPWYLEFDASTHPKCLLQLKIVIARESMFQMQTTVSSYLLKDYVAGFDGSTSFSPFFSEAEIDPSVPCVTQESSMGHVINFVQPQCIMDACAG
ncbi:hypothetical protein AVEN_120514-1 [Araneus ventricosus]|uniref:Uncharacterized protein n=1 Tax=Araneus ventricosus TaxID=182803 RepID=A0A4Y2MTA3_ARAVE|nr:hypothetical protein AVEN_120514-1 [Araneus ventricosus]